MRSIRFSRLAACLVLISALGTADSSARGRIFHRRDCVPCPPCCQPVNPCAPFVRIPPTQAPPATIRFATPRSYMLAAAANQFANQLPDMPVKPTPQGSTYQDCDARGDERGDQDLNFLKNRIDVADWIPVGIDAVLNQAYPAAVGRHHRSDWAPDDLAAVQHYEGLPISIVGYFVWAKDEGKESCNCHIDDKSMFDIHAWVTKAPVEDRDRKRAVVAEVTPRLKASHPNWTQARIRKLADDQKKVRVSGWLLLDQEHPEQIDKTRGTLWEIHPIMQIEVWENGVWVPLDDLQSMIRPRFRELQAFMS